MNTSEPQRLLKVLKFGGTSLGHVAALKRMASIVTQATETHRVIVVVSAIGKTTDQLVDLAAGPTTAHVVQSQLERLAERHLRLACDLLPKAELAVFLDVLDTMIQRLNRLVFAERASQVVRTDAILAMGERLSAALVSGVLQTQGLTATAHDATALVVTDATHGAAAVDVAATHRRLQAWYGVLPPTVTPVVTGFIGASPSGTVTTLGRGGSDYSAALVASGLNASVLERWTDVDGLYTDDPRRNPAARHLDAIILEEAWAWNHAGRLGMHRKALDPLVAAGIPVHVRSTLHPEGNGTRLIPSTSIRHRPAVGL